MAELSFLRRSVIEDMTIRNLSPATQRSYIHAVAKFSRHFGCWPDWLDIEDMCAYQVQLVAHGISWPASIRSSVRCCAALLLWRDAGSDRTAGAHLLQRDNASWHIDIPKELTVLTPPDGVKILACDARREGKYEWPAP